MDDILQQRNGGFGMSDTQPNEPSIFEDDIVFECPTCSKSLAIDRRGAGLTIHCPGCNSPVRIPIPDDMADMEIFQDEDGEGLSPEELTQTLRLAKVQISQLATTLSDLSAQRRELEDERRRQADQIEKLKRELLNVQEALDRVSFILTDLHSD